MRILCKNKDCKFCLPIEPEHFISRRGYIPLGPEDKYNGECSREILRFLVKYYENRDIFLRFTICDYAYETQPDEPLFAPGINCKDTECLWNEKGKCSRPGGIAMDWVKYGKEDNVILACRGRSDRKIKGHIDFFRFVNQEGSHLPDPPGYSDMFWEKKEAEIKKLRAQGVPEEQLNPIYGRKTGDIIMETRYDR